MAAATSEPRRTFFLLASLALVGALLYWAQPVMIPVTIAVLVTFVLAPVVAYLERRGLPRVVAASLAVLAVAALLLGIVHVFVLQATSLTSELPAYKTQVTEKIDALREAHANQWIADVVDFVNGIAKARVPDQVGQEQPTERIVPKMELPLIPVVQSVAGATAGIFLDTVLVLVLTLLILMRREDLRNRMIHVLGDDNLITATRAMDDASKRISRFLLFQLILNGSFGVVIAIGLFLIGVPYAYVWGAMAAILRYIPFLGGWIAAAFPLLASMVLPSWTPFLLTIAFFVVVELLQALLVEPLVFGHSIGVSGAGQLIAALFWACLWGPVGLILSTPLTACLCVLGNHFPVLHFFSTLMGDEEVLEKSAAFYQRLLAGDSSEANDLVESFLKEERPDAAVDEILMPALLLAQNDQKHGDLTKEDQESVTDAVRDIFYDVVAPCQTEHVELSSDGSNRQERLLLLNFPFNDEIDGLIVEMLRTVVGFDANHWSTVSIKNSQLDNPFQTEDGDPSVILLATSTKRNLARIRGACKAVHKQFPEAKILVCCWRLEAETDAIRGRLKDAGATLVCTRVSHALQFLGLDARTEVPMAAATN